MSRLIDSLRDAEKLRAQINVSANDAGATGETQTAATASSDGAIADMTIVVENASGTVQVMPTAAQIQKMSSTGRLKKISSTTDNADAAAAALSLPDAARDAALERAQRFHETAHQASTKAAAEEVQLAAIALRNAAENEARAAAQERIRAERLLREKAEARLTAEVELKHMAQART